MTMTFDEMMAAYQRPNVRKPPSNEEHQIQCACVRWFACQYPQLNGRLFAVPNGGKRSRKTASDMKAEGVVSGVSDLILLKSNRDYGALLIEMKTSKGSQTDTQKKWQQTITADGEYKYVVCRSLDDFIREVDSYLEQSNGQ